MAASGKPITGLEAVLMRLIRERLSLYKDNKGELVVSAVVQLGLRNEIMAAIEAANTPEKRLSGAYVMTPEASMAETTERQTGKRVKSSAAKPRAV